MRLLRKLYKYPFSSSQCLEDQFVKALRPALAKITKISGQTININELEG